MERRHFLQLFSLAPASVAAAEALAPRVNLVESPVELEHAKRTMLDVIGAPVLERTERRAHASYDLMVIPEGELVPDMWSFFSVPVGAPRPGVCSHCGMGKMNRFECKTLLDTNQLRANSFPPPEDHTFDAVVFVFNPRANEEDRTDMVENFYFELHLGSRIVARGPLARARVVGKLEDLVFLNTGHRKAVPLDAPYSIPFAKPIYVAPLQHFALYLHGHSFVTRSTLELYAFLDGVGDFFAVQ